MHSLDHEAVVVLWTLVFAAGASLPLLAGGILGAYWRPPLRLVAVALAFATGALISAVSFELFEDSYQQGGPLRAGLAFAPGVLYSSSSTRCWIG